MRKWCFIFVLIIGLAACSDDKDVLAPVPNDVTLNELSLERFTHIIPDGGFTSKAAHRNSVTFNTKKNGDGTYAGFAYSNRNNRFFYVDGPRKKRWIPIFIVFIPVSRMRMKFMPWEEWKEMMLILPWNLRRW